MLVQEPLRLREVVVKYLMGANLVWKIMLQKVSLMMICLFSVSRLATGETAELVNEDAEPSTVDAKTTEPEPADADTIESGNAASLHLRDSSESQPADIDTADTPETESSVNRKAAAEQKKQQRLEVPIIQWTSRMIV